MADNAHPSHFLTHVNGLRALAILGVLIYHLNAEYCPAGYFGVDVFLVISGYFLFRSLMNPQKAASFHYGHYLLGKAWRILPSWFVCCAVVTLLSYFLLLPQKALYAVNTAAASSVFGADYYIDHCYDYFNNFAQQNPLLHFWYLSITMQLFILAPLLVIPLLRLRWRMFATVLLGVLAVLSLAFYILASCGLLSNPARVELLSCIGAQSAYYHLLPRLWEILAGFFVLYLPSAEQRPRLQSLLACMGLVGIVASYFAYAMGSQASYIAVASAMLLIRYGHGGLCGHMLGWKPLQFVGVISFSLYLWHWPVMVFWKQFLPASQWGEVAMLVLSCLLGALAWFCVESRSGKGLSLPRLARVGILLAIPAMLLAALGAQPVLERRGASASQNLGEGQKGMSDAALLEHFNQDAFNATPVYCGENEAAVPEFLLLGDSHALHLYPGLNRACSERGLRGIALNNLIVPAWGCYEMTRWNAQMEEALYDYLKHHKEIKYILFASNWSYRLVCGPVSEGSGDTLVRDRERYETAIEKACEVFSSLGIKVIILHDTPKFSGVAPREEWERCKQLGQPEPPVRVVTRKTHQQNSRIEKAFAKRLVKKGFAHARIDLAVPLRQGDAYPCRKGDEFWYSDTNHLTWHASNMVGDYLMQEFLKIVEKDESVPRP